MLPDEENEDLNRVNTIDSLDSGHQNLMVKFVQTLDFKD